MRNRGIGRGRMFMGALLLLAAVMTWGITLTMSPHADPVVHGTEHVRSTIVTFKRNGAIGTLILCALAAWLLFPRRRPKWPARDWALIASFAFLFGTSIYTLIALRPSQPDSVGADENLAIMDINSSANGVQPMNTNAAPMPMADQSPSFAAVPSQAREKLGANPQRQSADAVVTAEQGADTSNAVSSDTQDEHPDNGVQGNEE